MAAGVTFLAGATAGAGGGVLTAFAVQALLLQQLIHTLDDALQALVDIQPHFLLPNQRGSFGLAPQQE